MKVLNGKSYGSIGHLPTSRRGPGDHGVNEGQARICCEKARPGDYVIVQEKLDGSNVGVVRKDGRILAVQRAGYLAASSPHLQHRYFALWVAENEEKFRSLLNEGERACGEWLAYAHGTRYELKHEPFVLFDIMKNDGMIRLPYGDLLPRAMHSGFVMPEVLHEGGALSIEDAMERLGAYGHHGAIDAAEGAVWRVETHYKKTTTVNFLAKYVRPEKKDGCYFPEISGQPEVWNWTPAAATLHPVQLSIDA